MGTAGAVTAAGASALALFLAHAFDASYFSSGASKRAGGRMGSRKASASRQNLRYSPA